MDFIISALVTALLNIASAIMSFFTGDFWLSLGVAEIKDGSIGGYFDTWFVGLSNIKNVFVAIGFFIALLSCCLNFMKGLLPLKSNANSEPVNEMLTRMGVAIFCVFFSYELFAFMQKPIAGIYNIIAEITTTNGFSQSFSFSTVGFFSLSFLDTGKNLAGSVICLVFIIALIIEFLRLVLEMVERYIILGIMFYTCPLAFSTLATKSSSGVFAAWLMALITEYILICSNLIFLGVFIYAYSQNKLVTNIGDFLLFTFALIAWLKTGTKLDQHLKGLGLNTLQSGGALLSAFTSMPIAKTIMSGGKSLFTQAKNTITGNPSASPLSSVTGYTGTLSKDEKVLSNGNRLGDLQYEVSSVQKGEGQFTAEGVGKVEDLGGLNNTQADKGKIEDNQLHLQYGEDGSDGSISFAEASQYTVSDTECLYSYTVGADGVERVGVWEGSSSAAMDHANVFGAEKLDNAVKQNYRSSDYNVVPQEGRPGAYIVQDISTGKYQAVELEGLYAKNEKYTSHVTTFGKGENQVQARITDIPDMKYKAVPKSPGAKLVEYPSFIHENSTKRMAQRMNTNRKASKKK